MIIYPHAHWLTIQASVQNVYPFTDPEALILKAQIPPLFKIIERLPQRSKYVFGDLIPPITEMLSRTGFERIEADGDFAVWRGPNS